MQRVRVSQEFNIVVPSEVRRLLRIQAGDLLSMDVRGEQVILTRDLEEAGPPAEDVGSAVHEGPPDAFGDPLKDPDDWVAALMGRHHEVWANVDAGTYIQGVRATG